jgi:hypothetical protein
VEITRKTTTQKQVKYFLSENEVKSIVKSFMASTYGHDIDDLNMEFDTYSTYGSRNAVVEYLNEVIEKEEE